ncbi:hypothetical protein ACE0DR_20130 [Azotobacter sp. CWF10]
MAEPIRIDPPGEGAWARRARMLDRYRWRLLRERHAWPGPRCASAGRRCSTWFSASGRASACRKPAVKASPATSCCCRARPR